jgi:hypothetical protein
MPMVRQLMVMTICHCLMVSHDGQHMLTHIMSILIALSFSRQFNHGPKSVHAHSPNCQWQVEQLHMMPGTESSITLFNQLIKAYGGSINLGVKRKS